MVFLNVIYLLVAVAMVALILMQRGAGAQAGSGFGGGASGTVFGARGASSFLTKATKWLAVAFFLISLFMAWQATRNLGINAVPEQGLGVMSQVPVAPVQPQGGDAAVPGVPESARQAPDAAAPTAPSDAEAAPKIAPTEPAVPPSGD